MDMIGDCEENAVAEYRTRDAVDAEMLCSRIKDTLSLSGFFASKYFYT